MAKTLVAVGCLFCILTGCGYYDAYVRAKQLRTYIDMGAICRSIDSEIEKNGRKFTQPEAEGILQSVNRGRDAWGSEFIYRSRMNGKKLSYILVSPGSDRAVDVANLEEYFLSPVYAVQGETWRDLVFRDGKPVTLAGK